MSVFKIKALKDDKEDPETVRGIIRGYASGVLLNTGNARAAHVLECFEEPLTESGFPGLVLSCYQAVED